MTDPDDSDDFTRLAKVMNKSHGYGGVFNYETPDDKSMVELHTAEEWCESSRVEFGLAIGIPETNCEDPPDCYVEIEGQRLGVELVQLIEREHKSRASKDESPFHGRLFMDMQWSRDRFGAALNEIIKTKGDNYKRREISVDVLVIHTAEPWLTSGQARDWLKDVEVQVHSNILNAFLLFDYEPGDVPHWPVFHLFGHLGSAQKNR
ncbi:hypothetical protein [Pseudogemmobacter sp. W21_MBD1_M6]|uniref:hypothetical protein n=1 Tax=Pseudogemmobacter sp. W21_MBD1_M6 TaxID=3240271 RepID=UPI003F981373